MLIVKTIIIAILNYYQITNDDTNIDNIAGNCADNSDDNSTVLPSITF